MNPKTKEQREFCEIFKQLEPLGWTRSRLAEHWGFSRSAITNILNGKSNPSESTLKRIRELREARHSAPATEPTAEDYLAKLKQDPSFYRVARTQLGALADQMAEKNKPVSSDDIQEAAREFFRAAGKSVPDQPPPAETEPNKEEARPQHGASEESRSSRQRTARVVKKKDANS